MNATAVATHLNIAESLIAEVQEWAHVLWVRFTSGRPRFVSKKKVKVMETVKLAGVVRLGGRNEIVRDGRAFSIPVQKASNKYGKISLDVKVGSIVHLDTHTWNGMGKARTGWFEVTATGDLLPSSVPTPQRPTKNNYPHEIYEEISEGRFYEG